MLPFAAAPEWVGDATVWLGLLVALGTLGGMVYAFSRVQETRFTNNVGEVIEDKVPGMIDTALEPMVEKVGHLHDCIERVGKEAAANARAATEAVTSVDGKLASIQQGQIDDRRD